MRPKVGLLPLYLKLYDDVEPGTRPVVQEFADNIASQLEMRGLDVVAAPICRLEPEFKEAVASFEESNCDAIITLHLAYSPSLESAEVLARTPLPVIVLDTTPTFSFSPGQRSSEIITNHGIHGVQDLCNLLIRLDKPFYIEVGHWEKSDVLDRVAGWARAAGLASAMRSARIGRIAEPFAGMGDFSVPEDVLRASIGVETVAIDTSDLLPLLPAEDSDEVKAEIAADLARFEVGDIDAKAHVYTTRTCLAVRKWMEREKLDGFTFNFGAITAESGLPTVPFLEASKAMARGKGYAGEGDVLTAALVSALASTFPETTFTEMFCPDWEGDTIFLSHMGELNVNLTDGQALLMNKPNSALSSGDPVAAVGRLKGGAAVLVDLAPGPEETYTLILAPVEMLGKDAGDSMEDMVRGWFKPCAPIADFLESYSRVGGTHHAALVYGEVLDDIVRFSQLMGWDTAIIG